MECKSVYADTGALLPENHGSLLTSMITEVLLMLSSHAYNQETSESTMVDNEWIKKEVAYLAVDKAHKKLNNFEVVIIYL